MLDNYIKKLKSFSQGLKDVNKQALDSFNENINKIEDKKLKAFFIDSLEKAQNNKLDVNEFVNAVNNASRNDNNE